MGGHGKKSVTMDSSALVPSPLEPSTKQSLAAVRRYTSYNELPFHNFDTQRALMSVKVYVYKMKHSDCQCRMVPSGFLNFRGSDFTRSYCGLPSKKLANVYIHQNTKFFFMIYCTVNLSEQDEDD